MDNKKQTPSRARELPDIQALAERLFVENWRPTNNSLTPDAFAAMCFRGAQEFCQVAARIAEGQSPKDILNPQVP